MSYAEAIAEFVQAAAAAGIAVELGDPEGAEAELCATVLGDQLAAEIVATGYPGGCEIPWVAEELYIYSLTELRERQAGYRTDARTGVDQDDWDADRWVIADWTADPVSINGTGVIAYRQGEAVRAIRYILREIAREIPAGGIVSNISQDPDDIATVFNALEELESVAGRKNANVYTSVVLALPHELDSGARERVLQSVCAVFQDLDVPYVGVLHKPDPERDERNHHAHVMFSWRPFSLTRDGCMFATGTHGDTAQAGFISSVRKRAANAMNAEMAAAGYDRRFLGEKRADQGVAPTSGKDGPGKKHRERRAADIAAMTAELTRINARQIAVAAAMAAAESIMTRPNVDRLAILNALTAKDSEIVEAARVKLLPTEPVSERPMVVPAVEAISIESGSHTPVSPRATVEPHGPTDRNLAANSPSSRSVLTSGQSLPSTPVSHEKPPAVKPSDAAVKPVATTSSVVTPTPDRGSTINPITTTPDMAGPKVRPSSGLAKAMPEPANHKRAVPPASAQTPDPIIERQPDERRRPNAELLRRAARLTFPTVPAADLGNGYTGRSLQRTGGLSRVKKMSDAVVPGVTLLACSSPPTKQFESERLAAGPLKSATKGVGSGKQAEARREATRRGCLMELQAMLFLPIRMVPTEGGRERFMLVPEQAIRNDSEIIERAIQFQEEAAFQQLFHQKWAAYLARLQVLLIKRKYRSSPDILRGQIEANPSLAKAEIVALVREFEAAV